MESAKEKGKVENRTIEQLLKDLREEKGWTYLQVVEKLQELGLSMDDKKVKKWEIGLEYPEINEIYKLSELYFVASENFVMAKSNSYKEGFDSIHATFIKWICYFTGVSLKIGYIGFYVALGILLIGSLMYFVDCIHMVIDIGKENI